MGSEADWPERKADMTVIICLDNNGGRMFHGRRQSRDGAVTEKIREICKGKKLWMNAGTWKLYGGLNGVETIADEEFLIKAQHGDYCLSESDSLSFAKDNIHAVIVFRWNRSYPSDVRLDLDLENWEKINALEFPGTSHEKITLEYYKRNGALL